MLWKNLNELFGRPNKSAERSRDKRACCAQVSGGPTPTLPFLWNLIAAGLSHMNAVLLYSVFVTRWLLNAENTGFRETNGEQIPMCN